MSALPKPRDPLLRMLNAQQIGDAEMRAILRTAASEARAIVNSYGDTFSSRVRAAQLDLARSQQQMWRTVGYQTEAMIGDGVDAAADSMSLLMDVFLNSLGVQDDWMRQAMLQQARNGIDALVARGANGIPLSQSVYRTSVATGQQLDRVINGLVLNGASASEIASRVYKFVDPATPGGASYAAMRLGRTELNNAFHTTTVREYDNNPFVERTKWNLSGSHPKPDECNQYAERVHRRGWEPGEFATGSVPPKPHPNCLCYMTAVTMDDDEFVKQFAAGKFDSYIDGLSNA